MATALDYSSGRPSGAAVRAAQHAGVIRYAGTPGRTKNITKPEFQDMDRNGIGVALVYENKAGDALTGRSGGVASASAILGDSRGFGFPESRPRYLAVDQDITTQMGAVVEYFRGANTVLGVARTGVYGEADVLDALFDAGVVAFGWQTAAWSRGRKAKRSQLFQRIGTTNVGGIDCDINDILASDWGQHNAQEADVALTEHEIDLIADRVLGRQYPTELGGQRLYDLFNREGDQFKSLSDKIAALATGTAPAIDYDKLAAALAPHLQTVDYAQIAKAVADEDHRRSEA